MTKHYNDAQRCCLCGGSFDKDKGFARVKKHDHKQERSAVQTQKCSITYYSNRYLPVMFHNLSGYGSHYIIKKHMKLAKNQLKCYQIDMIMMIQAKHIERETIRMKTDM